MIKLLLILQLQMNLVLIRQDRRDVQIPADLSVTPSYVYVHLPDTTLSYLILSTSSYQGDTVITLSGIGYSGIIRFFDQNVYLYSYNSHRSLELYFSRNRSLYKSLKRHGRKK